MEKCFSFIFLLLLCITNSRGQQVADTAFHYPIQSPAYKTGKGPVVTLDEAHYNFHTLSGRYAPFGQLLADDGYQLRSGREVFSADALSRTDILVIANALADTGEWRLPARSAFTPDEVRAVSEWVKQGGSLLLIADHMPFAGTAEALGAAFGFTFIDGFAVLPDRGLEVFSRREKTLMEHPITQGRTNQEHIDAIIVFTGQAFMVPDMAVPLTRLPDGYEILLPSVAWDFSETTPRISGRGLSNGACLEWGKGRVVVMGEAAMFSAQVSGPQRHKAGMNHPRAGQNPQFLLNIMHWLDRTL